jgi:hypothetical protein
MTAPVRIQRRRSAGWRMPPNTVYVGRVPRTISLFGNPFLGERGAAVTAYFAYLASPHHFHIMRRTIAALAGKLMQDAA